ncbi:MAG: hypothetical protein AAF806_13280 [Bacteroidota bacterium]
MNMTSITFRRTANIFINAGIVGLYQYLEEYKNDESLPPYEYRWLDDKNGIHIQSEKLTEFLEVLYYRMGKEVYDTSGKNARAKEDKYYFVEEPFSYEPFFKMKTYGVGALITNDPQPIPKIKENAISFKKLAQEKEIFANKIAKVYAKNGWKLKDFEVSENGFTAKKGIKGDAKIFLNEPYIKITRLEPLKREHLQEGDEKCYLTNEGFKKLVDVQNTSPFVKGLNNFTSNLTPTSQKVSWKTMYVSRFSPKLALYSYISGLDSIVCFFFDSNTLQNLHQLYHQNSAFYKDELQLIEGNYMSNFNTYSFYAAKKGGEKYESPRDYAAKEEVQFALIYTIYQQLLAGKKVENIEKYSSFFQPIFEEKPISLISLRADKFSGTLRPNSFEYFNNFKFIISLILHLERNGIDFGQIMQSLKFLKNAHRSSKNSYQLERVTRNRVLGSMLNGKSILADVSLLFYQCYTYLISNNPTGYKNYKQLSKLIQLYESLIQLNMTKEMQEKAFNLGTSIGRAIIDFEQPKDNIARKNNAKAGRKYLIDLQKARNLEQFNDAIIRIQNKYLMKVKTELFKTDIGENNFNLTKQFAIIGALNQINSVLEPITKKDNNNE